MKKIVNCAYGKLLEEDGNYIGYFSNDTSDIVHNAAKALNGIYAVTAQVNAMKRQGSSLFIAGDLQLSANVTAEIADSLFMEINGGQYPLQRAAAAFSVELPLAEVLKFPQKSPLYVTFSDAAGSGYKSAVVYKHDSAAIPQRLLHTAIIRLKDYRLEIYIRESAGGNAFFMVNESTVTSRPWQRIKIRFACFLSERCQLKKAAASILLFEKRCEKFEESAAALYCGLLAQDKGENVYFILNRKSSYYYSLPAHLKKHIIRQFSLKHYLYFFQAHCFLGSETIAHSFELGTADQFARARLMNGNFRYVFLQHGIMIASLQGANSSYIKGRDFPRYGKVVTSSLWENDNFINNGNFYPEDFYTCGLPKFDAITKISAQDKIVIMPTSRKWEVNLMKVSPQETTYFRFAQRIVNSVPENLRSEIVLIPHPLFGACFAGTSLAQYTPGVVNYNEILRSARIVITDFSSISFDAFYGGSQIILCRQDFEYCEKMLNNKIMLDDNYAFYHVNNDFSILGELITECYDSAQSETHKKNFLHYAAFNDNQNTQRLISMLEQDHIFDQSACYLGSVAKCTVRGFINKKIYTGEEVVQKKLCLYYKSMRLIENEDYVLNYEDNVNPGQTAVTVRGVKRFDGQMRLPFIIRVSAADFSVEMPNHFVYTGEAIVPKITVCYKGVRLLPETDYVIVVDDNVSRGVAQVAIKGRHAYGGQKTLYFVIE